MIDTCVVYISTALSGLRSERSQGVSKGSPFGLLGLFQRRRADALRKSPNRLWLFCGGKAVGAERPNDG